MSRTDLAAPRPSRARMLRAIASTIRTTKPTASAVGAEGTGTTSRTSRRASAAVAGVASALALLAAGSSTEASAPAESTPAAERGVQHEVIGTVTAPGEINLAPGLPLRVGSPGSQWMLEQWLAEGTDGVLADSVATLVNDAYPNYVARDTALLVGLVHTGCLPPIQITVASDATGRVRLGAVPDPQEAATLCEIVEPTIAVVAVDIDDVPVGSADAATLVSFGQVDYGSLPDSFSVELTGLDPAAADTALATILPPPDTALNQVNAASFPPVAQGDRRIAFLLAGCLEDTAELIITPAFVSARLELTPDGQDADCARANFYLSVFDVTAADIPSTAVIRSA